MVTGDGAYIKKLNRGLILKVIIEHGLISRADLSKITGLKKATISTQVADLLKEDLIYERPQAHTTVGRRPIMLSINREAAYVLGIDLDYKKVHYSVFDLQGNLIFNNIVKLQTVDYDEIVQILIEQIKYYSKVCSNSHYGLVNVMFGLHATVNKDESILFVPTYQWHNKNLKSDLQKEIDIPISIENSANLSAYAERVYKHHHSDHLIAIILSSGIGVGIIMDGKLNKGYNGYAGEMGHMIISPMGKPCRCGNHGCWELYSGEPRLFTELASQLDTPNLTHQNLKELFTQSNPIVCQHMEQFIYYLSIGLNNIINSYDPETLVLTSEVLEMYPNIIEKIKSNLTSSMGKNRKIYLSELGNKSCVFGACALAIQRFLEVPELILTVPEEGTHLYKG